MKVVLNYAGKTSEKAFFIKIAEEAGDAEIVEKTYSFSKESLLIFTQGIAIIILIIVVLILFLKKRKQRKVTK